MSRKHNRCLQLLSAEEQQQNVIASNCCITTPELPPAPLRLPLKEQASKKYTPAEKWGRG